MMRGQAMTGERDEGGKVTEQYATIRELEEVQ